MSMNKRGDTIVEVLLATALLSAILFGSWAIVNRASQISLAARQRVYMVDQLKEQAEIIKAYYAAPGGRAGISAGTFGADPAPAVLVSEVNDNPCDSTRDNATKEINATLPASSFYFDSDAKLKSQMKSVDSFDNARVWVQRVETENTTNPAASYNDFYIQACWLSTGGGEQKEDNSKLIVRLNR